MLIFSAVENDCYLEFYEREVTYTLIAKGFYLTLSDINLRLK